MKIMSQSFAFLLCRRQRIPRLDDLLGHFLLPAASAQSHPYQRGRQHSHSCPASEHKPRSTARRLTFEKRRAGHLQAPAPLVPGLDYHTTMARVWWRLGSGCKQGLRGRLTRRVKPDIDSRGVSGSLKIESIISSVEM